MSCQWMHLVSGYVTDKVGLGYLPARGHLHAIYPWDSSMPPPNLSHLGLIPPRLPSLTPFPHCLPNRYLLPSSLSSQWFPPPHHRVNIMPVYMTNFTANYSVHWHIMYKIVHRWATWVIPKSCPPPPPPLPQKKLVPFSYLLQEILSL